MPLRFHHEKMLIREHTHVLRLHAKELCLFLMVDRYRPQRPNGSNM